MVLLSEKHPIDITIGQELPPTFHYAWVILPASGTGQDIQAAIVYRAARGAGSAVAPVWQGLELIRDPYTHAAKGQVSITAVALWAFSLIRSDAYVRRAFKVA